MQSPSWVELMGRHAGSATLFVSAAMTFVADTECGHSGGSFDFWHGPGQQWRVEIDGRVVFIQDGNGVAFHQDDDGDLLPMVGDALMPLVSYSWTPRSLIPPSSVPYSLSVEARVVGPPLEETICGRRAWVTTLESGSEQLSVAFDDATGIEIRVGLNGVVQMAVSDLVEHDVIDERLFTWPPAPARRP